jgi:IS5 family transposase
LRHWGGFGFWSICPAAAVAHTLNNLSDEQVEYQVRDRLSFSRFLGLAIEDSIPDATTLWLFREKLHDSQELDGLVGRDRGQTQGSAYNSRIHRRGRRNHPLSLTRVRVNHAKSRIRARIEHVFGAQQIAPGGRIVRTIGIVRARTKIGLQKLAYNIRRLVTLERLAAA